MRNIKLNTKDDRSGKVVYNAGIVHNIVALAVAEVEGAMLVPGKKNGISLYLEKDGVYADVSVVVKYGYNVPELAYRIQQSVKQNVENMTRYRVAEVDVHIRDVVFVDAPPVEKEDEEEASEEPSAEQN
ncbi:MAG: Asp23/Gls24 family envelope stress response protein [Clostridia bacterium]|nr:Asp23/Gls24 family envelope stress response protein [Clostridia bacterium]